MSKMIQNIIIATFAGLGIGLGTTYGTKLCCSLIKNARSEEFSNYNQRPYEDYAKEPEKEKPQMGFHL